MMKWIRKYALVSLGTLALAGAPALLSACERQGQERETQTQEQEETQPGQPGTGQDETRGMEPRAGEGQTGSETGGAGGA